MNVLQQEITNYLRERGWGTSQPGEYAKSISIEAGELLESFQWSNATAEELKANQAKLAEISHEMADVVIYAVQLCNVLDIDFEKAVLTKLALVRQKYPAEVVRGKPDRVRQIHKDHRDNKG